MANLDTLKFDKYRHFLAFAISYTFWWISIFPLYHKTMVKSKTLPLGHRQRIQRCHNGKGKHHVVIPSFICLNCKLTQRHHVATTSAHNSSLKFCAVFTKYLYCEQTEKVKTGVAMDTWSYAIVNVNFTWLSYATLTAARQHICSLKFYMSPYNVII